MNRVLRWCSELALLGIFATAAWAQSAQISGRVMDNSGAVVPEVKIKITNAATGVARETASNESGDYIIPQLQPGTYNISAEKQGFRTTTESGVRLDVDQRASLNLVLQVGQLTEEVSVVASAPLLDTVEPSIGQVINNKQIVDLPLNGRDYIQLALLSSGTVNPLSGNRDGGFSVGGQRTSANNYLLDGVDNTSIELADAGRSAELVKPSVDAIQEFKVQTNTYSAEYGHGTGAVINVTIKSGTNDFHGTAFEFLRNEKVDAKNFFASPTAPTPEYRRNQYGFSFGGPIIKNHTFFFGDWEGTNIRQAQSAVNTVATTGEQSYMFAKTITNPLTGQPFPNNAIPASLVDPVAARLITLYPAPQNSKTSANYLYNGPNNEDDHRFDGRVDHTFNEHDSIFGRISHYGRGLPAVLNLPPPAFGANGFDGTINGWNDSLGWNHVFSPSLITSSRVAWSFSRFTRMNPAAAGKENLNAKYGILGGDTTDPGDFSDFAISGYAQIGIGQNNPVRRDSQGRQFVNDTDWIHGNHDVKFGVNILRAQNNIFNSRGEVGSYSFNGQYTGDGLADFLLGWPSQFVASSPVSVNLRGWLLAGYIQDDWKVNPKLTVNLGLRYEWSTPYTERYNRSTFSDFHGSTGITVPGVGPLEGITRF
ncbi:MAG: TonB-dependent receptor, partial [Acidobacteriaceae bacterium]|nr:TonB-dependent receptor [Acidobacteriaceae bacterium]